ncbi:hypothetical protein, conserved [Trypanosoma brucei brucei TREU927]|uniref:N-acetyltransferase ESCO acetyl-transferase domain-containing protein n=1 Tax=Trypanosoma brucei brucei (strain 927/4 GUTat10.1) TaxID=185431 RepID=Q4GZ53_TRYB2|nr:hypothetical protein, conserved [Trypanosoma brucei brucei TREU927]CAJ16158.1 hypothetical protein, conserved [Trypanosoma brucei brucei TREU927]
MHNSVPASNTCSPFREETVSKRGKRSRGTGGDDKITRGTCSQPFSVITLPPGKLLEWLVCSPCRVYDVNLPRSRNNDNNISSLQCAVLPNFFVEYGGRSYSCVAKVCKPQLRKVLLRALAAVRQEMGSVDDIPHDSLLVVAVSPINAFSSECIHDASRTAMPRAREGCKIVGLCVARELSAPHRMHCESNWSHEKSEASGVGAAVQEGLGDCWEEDATRVGGTNNVRKAFCGVQLVWVADCYRRHGVAKVLVDTARRHISYGFEVPVERVAFSEPTSLGKLFAKSYSGRPDFLIF